MAGEARAGEAGAHAAPLYDHRCWSAAPGSIQDRIIASLAGDLRWDYDQLETRRFECANRGFRVGRFAHRLGQMVLHLIPGDRDHAPLLMGACVVTRLAWSRAERPTLEDELGGRPQVSVSLNEIREWLGKLGGALRLPSEPEWEYACRATATSAFPWGEELDLGRVWCREREPSGPRSSDAHRGLGNAFGLIDMLGNVWERCESSPGSGYAPRAPHLSANHILKGGSYTCPADRCRVETRDFGALDQRDAETGFRVCRSLPGL